MNRNKCTNSQNSLFNYKAERFKFPHTDTDIERYTTKRSPPDIIMNIIRVLNNKLKSNEYELWNKLCERDVATPEYYKLGLAMLATDLRKLSKEFKLNPDKLPTVPDMLPAKMSNVALTTKHGQWDRQQLITAIHTHIYSGHTLYSFLHKENALAVIRELLLICTEIKIIKLLQRYSRT